MFFVCFFSGMEAIHHRQLLNVPPVHQLALADRRIAKWEHSFKKQSHKSFASKLFNVTNL